MCGIVAIIRKRFVGGEAESYLESAVSAIVHRGPDGIGKYVDGLHAFANVRLAIVDVEGGDQPIFNEEKSVGIVYNGEVYNYLDLRRDLEDRGYRFRTKSDTEVVLRAYEAYGVEAFGKLNGMFGFCMWDARSGDIFVVRDPLGIKPMYVYEDSDKIICCSEFKGIAAIPDVDLEIDSVGIQDYLLFRYVQAPYTLFQRVRCLEAGTYLRIHGDVSVHYSYPLP